MSQDGTDILQDEGPMPGAKDRVQGSLADSGIRTYVLRTGRMTEGQKQAIEVLGPRHCVAFTPGHCLDLEAVFGRRAPVIMEIGFGMGQATWRIALQKPEQNFLGIEVHTPGVGRLLLDIEREGIGNLKIVNHDAIELLETGIAPGSLAGYHIFYPDPWPKKRHFKRRLIRDGLTGLLASRLAPGGYLYFVTDIESYAEQALEVLARTPGLRNRYDGFAPHQEWRPETKFEARALSSGRGVMELVFERV